MRSRQCFPRALRPCVIAFVAVALHTLAFDAFGHDEPRATWQRSISTPNSTSVIPLQSAPSPAYYHEPGADNSRQLQQSSSSGHRKVSVVLLNWQRPRNVQKIIQKYVEYETVLEIIVWMCHPDTKFEFPHAKVRIIDDVAANDHFGLSTRFKACLLAKSPWVLIQDDDHYLREKGLQKLIAFKEKNPLQIVGTFGRDWPHGQVPQYIKRPVGRGPCRIVLTILLLTDTAACAAFWQHAPLVEPYVREHSKPLWNGEDIFFSLVSYKTTGKLPLVVKPVAKVFMSQQSTGIHFVGGHDNYRDAFVKYAAKALKLDYGDGYKNED